METKIFKNITQQDIEYIGKSICNGEVIALPTETVYGLGANGLDSKALEKIYIAKGRPSDNPLILHVANSNEVNDLVEYIPKIAKNLMEAFWPGPLTITLPKSDKVPMKATGGLNTVALRCPAHDICRAIIAASGVPIAAPSANLSGKPSPTTAMDVYNDMNGKIAGIVDGGECLVGIESTVIEVLENSVTILRPGAITEEMLSTVVDEVHFDKALLDKNTAPKAPGMKYKHYAPNANMYTFVGKSDVVANKIVDKIKANANLKYALIVSYDVESYLRKNITEKLMDNIHFLTYGKKDDLTLLAHVLYSNLLKCNALDVDMIIAEGVEERGLGVAIMNRLAKASNNNVIKV